jgi:hypothetical protein
MTKVQQTYVIRKDTKYYRGVYLQGYTDDQLLAAQYEKIGDADEAALYLRNFGHSVVVEPYFPPPKVV